MYRLSSLTVPVLVASLAATSAHAQFDDCRFEAERTATVDAAGARRLEILARAGSLEVEGRAGLTEVRVRGRACAPDEAVLEEIELAAERRGDDVLIEALIPETVDWRDGYARLDLVIEAPAGLAADIEDSSGAMKLRGLGGLTIRDGSGETEVEDISGPVRLTDGSGEIRLRRVSGDVDVEDGSGEIEVREVEGLVELADGSGSITVTDVTGDVRVRRDGSGSISVRGVSGDFVVARDGTGDVRYRDVGGAVRIAGR